MLYVKGAERSGVAVGALLLAQSLPHLLGPVAGTVIDRLEVKRVMVGCELTQAVIFAAIAWWQPPFAALLALVVMASTLDTTFSPAAASALPALVEGPQLLQANAWMGTSINLQVAVGPMLGGLLVSAFGVRGGLYANSLSFAASAALLLGLPHLARVRVAGAGILSSGLEGLAFAWKNAMIRALLIGLFLVVAFAAVDNVALVFLARDVLHTSALGYGIVAGAFGVGMLAGSVGLLRMQGRARSAPLLVGAWLITGVGTLLTGLAPAFGVAVATQALAGVGNGIDNAAIPTLVQQLVPREILGRVYGLVGTAAFAGSATAYALAGFLLDATSPRMVFIVGGLGALAALALTGPTLLRASRPRSVR